jgi:hypothetical protein
MKRVGLTAAARQARLKREVEADAAHKAGCTKEIDETHATINKNQEEYDKQLLTLSSGSLLLALAFIKDVVPTDQAIDRWLLYASFVVLTICVLSVLASYQISNAGLSRAKLYWENQRDGDKQMPFPYHRAEMIKRWNFFSGIAFSFGIILAMCFVIINLHQEAILSDQRSRTTDGQQVKIPASGDWAQKGANIKAPPRPAPQPRPPADNKK